VDDENNGNGDWARQNCPSLPFGNEIEQPAG